MSSRLDYCNSLFSSLTDLTRLLCVKNSFCRVVTHSSKYSPISPPPELKELYWLPVKYTVQLKRGLNTYKILKYSQPAYLSETNHLYTSCRKTRHSISKFKFLHIPSFDCGLHKSHNLIPSPPEPFLFHIRNSPSAASFRKNLKTHLI